MAAAAGAASGGVTASGAAAQLAGDRAQGESTADAATSGRFAGALQALSASTTQAGRLAAGVAATAADVLSSAGVGHSAPYYGQSSGRGLSDRSTGGRSAQAPGSGVPGQGRRHLDGEPEPPAPASPAAGGVASNAGDDSAAPWPPTRLEPPAPRGPRDEAPEDGGAR